MAKAHGRHGRSGRRKNTRKSSRRKATIYAQNQNVLRKRRDRKTRKTRKTLKTRKTRKTRRITQRGGMEAAQVVEAAPVEHGIIGFCIEYIYHVDSPGTSAIEGDTVMMFPQNPTSFTKIIEQVTPCGYKSEDDESTMRPSGVRLLAGDGDGCYQLNIKVGDIFRPHTMVFCNGKLVIAFAYNRPICLEEYGDEIYGVFDEMLTVIFERATEVQLTETWVFGHSMGGGLSILFVNYLNSKLKEGSAPPPHNLGNIIVLVMGLGILPKFVATEFRTAETDLSISFYDVLTRTTDGDGTKSIDRYIYKPTLFLEEDITTVAHIFGAEFQGDEITIYQEMLASGYSQVSDRILYILDYTEKAMDMSTFTKISQDILDMEISDDDKAAEMLVKAQNKETFKLASATLSPSTREKEISLMSESYIGSAEMHVLSQYYIWLKKMAVQKILEDMIARDQSAVIPSYLDKVADTVADNVESVKHQLAREQAARAAAVAETQEDAAIQAGLNAELDEVAAQTLTARYTKFIESGDSGAAAASAPRAAEAEEFHEVD